VGKKGKKAEGSEFATSSGKIFKKGLIRGGTLGAAPNISGGGFS